MYNCRCKRYNMQTNNINAKSNSCNCYNYNASTSPSFQPTNMNNSCNCGYDDDNFSSVFPNNPVLGQSYVPIHTMGKTFIPSVGLKMGTLFPELVMPYSPCQSLEEIAFIKAMNKTKEGCNEC